MRESKIFFKKKLQRRIVVLYVLFFAFIPVTFSQQLVLPGDHPDPSVVKIGDTYWASSTTSNWFPAFPIMKSKDLIHWKQQGYVFNKIPEWVDFYFWAPEISYDNGKVYVYYAAHKKNGNLCVSVASADKPEGPYKDLGPLVCQEDGSIDAFPMRDENGKLFLIWKEDANSIGRPTPIWAQQMNEERTALVGEKKELFRNTAKWEGNLVEGVSMIKYRSYFYAFYAAAGCCGAACSYGVGVARAKNLLGPWEKYEQNPILTNDDKWICPGHGTPIEKNGRHYFMYHSYDKTSNIFTGRQGLLIEYKFTSNGWIQFVKQNAPEKIIAAKTNFDDFNGKALSDKWQWSVFQKVNFKVRNGNLELSAVPGAGTYIGQKVTSANYTATTLIDNHNSSAAAGIGIIGDDKSYVAAFYQNGKVKCIVLKDGKEQIITERSISQKNGISLRVIVTNSKNILFYYSDQGKFTALNNRAIDGSYLPPWDRALRVGIFSKGETTEKAVFKKFDLINR